MKDSEKSSRALRCPPVAEIPKGQKSQASKVDGKSRPFPDVLRSKNCLAWYVALNSKAPKEKTACIPQVKWKCPPKFKLNPCWHVVAGEGSQEAKAQMHKATTVLEVVYSHHTSNNTVPPSPSSPTDRKDEHCNDRQIPIIPIIPVEEEEMSLDTSVPASSIKSQLPAFSTCPSAFQNLPLSQWNAVGPQGGLINNKSLPDKLHGLEGSDLQVAVAAATTVAAIIESKEQIDTELLMKILSNPEMVKNLIDENKSSCKPGEHGTPASAAETAASVEQNTERQLGIECSAQLSRSIPANTNTYTRPNQSISLPCTKVEPLGRIQVGNVAIPTLTSKSGEHSYIYQTSVVKPVRRVVMPSTLRPDEGIMKRWNSQCGPPDTSITKQQESLDPPIASKPRTMEEIKQMINKYGTADAGKNLMSPPLVVATPTTTPIRGHSHARMEGMAAKILSEVGIIDRDRNHYRNHHHHQWGPRPSSFCASSTQLKAAMPLVMPPRMESQPSLPASPGISHFATPPPPPPPTPPFSPLTTNFGHLMELNYNSSSPHGQKDETRQGQEHKFLRLLGQPGQPLPGHKTPPIEINSKYQGPCNYFNSTMGFRNGSECPSGHGHETSKQQRTGGLEKVAAAATKRMKFSK